MRVWSLPGLMTAALGLLVQAGCSQDEGPNSGIAEGGGNVQISTAPLTIPSQYGPVANAHYWAVVRYMDGNNQWRFLTAVGAEDNDAKDGVRAGAWPPGCTGDGCYVDDGADGFRRADGTLYVAGAAQLVVPCVVSDELLWDPDYRKGTRLGALCLAETNVAPSQIPGSLPVADGPDDDGNECEPTLGVGLNEVTVGIAKIEVNHPNSPTKLTEITEVDTGFVYPSPISQQVVCIERQDVLAPFVFDVLRRGVQGSLDVTVDIRDMFCSMKYDCPEYGFVSDANGDRLKSLITAISCTPGADADGVSITYNYNLKCYGEGGVVLDMTGAADEVTSVLDVFAKQARELEADLIARADVPTIPPLKIIAEEYSGVESLANKVYTNAAYGFPLELLEQKKPSHCELTAIAVPQELIGPEPPDTCVIAPGKTEGKCARTLDEETKEPLACTSDADCATWKPVVNPNQHAVVWNVAVTWPELACENTQLPCESEGNYECLIDAASARETCVGEATTCDFDWPQCFPVMQTFACEQIGNRKVCADDFETSCVENADCGTDVACVPYTECTGGPNAGMPCQNGYVDCEIPAQMECEDKGATCDFDKYCVDTSGHIGDACATTDDCTNGTNGTNATCQSIKLHCGTLGTDATLCTSAAAGCAPAGEPFVACEETKGACSNGTSANPVSCSQDSECGVCNTGDNGALILCDLDAPVCPALGHCGVDRVGICDPDADPDESGCEQNWFCPDGTACVEGEDCGASRETGTCQNCTKDVYCENPQLACNPQVVKYEGACQPDPDSDATHPDYICAFGAHEGDDCDPSNGDRDCDVPEVVPCAAPATGTCVITTPGTTGTCSNHSGASCEDDDDCGTCAFPDTSLVVQCDAAADAVNTCQVGRCGDEVGGDFCFPGGANTCPNVWACPDTGESCQASAEIVSVEFSRTAVNGVAASATNTLTVGDRISIFGTNTALDGLTGQVANPSATGFEIEGVKWPSSLAAAARPTGSVKTQDLCTPGSCEEVLVGSEPKSCDPSNAFSCRTATCEAEAGTTGADCTDEISSLTGLPPIGVCGSKGGFCGGDPDGDECDPDAVDADGNPVNTCPVAGLCPDGTTPCDPTADGPVCGYDYKGTMTCGPGNGIGLVEVNSAPEAAVIPGGVSVVQGTYVGSGPAPFTGAPFGDGNDDYWAGYFIPHMTFPLLTGADDEVCDGIETSFGAATTQERERHDAIVWGKRSAEEQMARYNALQFDFLSRWALAFSDIAAVFEIFDTRQPPSFDTPAYDAAVATLERADDYLAQLETDQRIPYEGKEDFQGLRDILSHSIADLRLGYAFPRDAFDELLGSDIPSLREALLADISRVYEGYVKIVVQIAEDEEALALLQKTTLPYLAAQKSACDAGLLTFDGLLAFPLYDYFQPPQVAEPLPLLSPWPVQLRARIGGEGLTSDVNLDYLGASCFAAPKSGFSRASGLFSAAFTDAGGERAEGVFGLSFNFGKAFPGLAAYSVEQKDKNAIFSLEEGTTKYGLTDAIDMQIAASEDDLWRPSPALWSDLAQAFKERRRIQPYRIAPRLDSKPLLCALSPTQQNAENGFVERIDPSALFDVGDALVKRDQVIDSLEVFVNRTLANALEKGQSFFVDIWQFNPEIGFSEHVGKFPLKWDHTEGVASISLFDENKQLVELRAGLFHAVLADDKGAYMTVGLEASFADSFQVYRPAEQAYALSIYSQLNKSTESLTISQYCHPSDNDDTMVFGLIKQMPKETLDKYAPGDVVGVVFFERGFRTRKMNTREEPCIASFEGGVFSLGSYSREEAERELEAFAANNIARNKCGKDDENCQAYYDQQIDAFMARFEKTIVSGIPDGLYVVQVVAAPVFNINKGWNLTMRTVYTSNLFSLWNSQEYAAHERELEQQSKDMTSPIFKSF